ncbi:MAG: DUF2721 domain-containing protein [Leptolyngbya sp. BL-A-14]
MKGFELVGGPNCRFRLPTPDSPLPTFCLQHYVTVVSHSILFAMELTLTTPALLFPAISLVLLAYTNRFLTLAALIRNLHADYKDEPDPCTLVEIRSLRYRVRLVRDMQFLGVSSFLLCVVCMFVLFTGQMWLGGLLFGLSLVLLMGSLALSVREIQVSIDALDLHLRDLEAMR